MPDVLLKYKTSIPLLKNNVQNIKQLETVVFYFAGDIGYDWEVRRRCNRMHLQAFAQRKSRLSSLRVLACVTCDGFRFFWFVAINSYFLHISTYIATITWIEI